MQKHILINMALLSLLLVLGLVVWLDPFTNPTPPSTLTTISPARVHKISVSNQNQLEFELELHTNQTDTAWFLTKPLKMPANSMKVEQLLTLLNTNSFRQYRIKSDNLAKLGLEKPGWEIAFDADSTHTVIQFGKTEPIEQKRYVLLGDTVHLIIDHYSQYNVGSPFMLANLDILPVDKSVKELHLPDKVIKKVDGKWQSTPSGDSISQKTYIEFIDEWRYAQALRVALADKSALSSDAQPVTVVLEKADQPIHFMIEATEQNYVITNKDWGVRYYLNSSVGEKLLHIHTPGHD